MNEYANYPRVVESTGNASGWTAVIAAGVGGVLGYLFGRGNNGNGGCSGGGGCQTCFQQGEYTGENRAGINYIAQTVNGLGNKVDAMNNDLKDQRINDLVAKNQSLETQLLVRGATDSISCQVGQVNRTLDSVVTGCGIKSYPGCNNGF